MATEQWINSAAHEQKPGMFSDMSGGALIACPPGTPEAEAAERAAAIRNNRRLANHHGCPGLCDAPAHARDVDAGVEVLEALGLIPYRYEPGQSAHRWCGRCKQNRPAADFDDDTVRIRSGVVACCRPCAEDRRVARRAAKKRKKTA